MIHADSRIENMKTVSKPSLLVIAPKGIETRMKNATMEPETPMIAPRTSTVRKKRIMNCVKSCAPAKPELQELVTARNTTVTARKSTRMKPLCTPVEVGNAVVILAVDAGGGVIVGNAFAVVGETVENLPKSSAL